MKTKPYKFGTCGVCDRETFLLLTDEDKDRERANWAGVDFYDEICIPCFQKLEDEI